MDELFEFDIAGLAEADEEDDDDSKVSICWQESELLACVEAERPAVLRQCARFDWWPGFINIEYLRRHCGERKVKIVGQYRLLSEYFDSVEIGNEKAYLRNQQLRDLLPPDEFVRLRFPLSALGQNALSQAVETLPEAWRQWFELFLLPAHSQGYPFLHKDVCETHAFSMQLFGAKRFTLYPPNNSTFLYPQPPTYCRSALPQAGRNINLEMFPMFASARPFSFVLEPGDLFFLPRNFWHSTRPEPTQLTKYGITIGGNFVSPSTYPTFQDEFADYAAMRDLARDYPAAAAILS
mmetsp:Transcript_3780/g.5289  ORF Transcript_3780/g.5289 Transcript_3780/m.5289 type:complete len:294 (+) Transcript_3780:36-917(+)|eukprot:CAMPEP_0197296150 /NCGR_PEP_ID=MMETSP0890-20130614/37603_1 /TAXON_ID=44058 ORGANISM="Aureoumbra lagunensis, Strain CCMP1510" /NCGR_SAMPLE_ID=MMETSP0890 /ASSEMBLY_ACC=CAM_ASM_000533 /LENGTH=293 /DNA_ID=CAMNT_0042772533 /DNA_START=22 /DNA_END=903 /DNA_ORIENTATION=+